MPPIRNYQYRPQSQTTYRQNNPHPSVGLGYWYPYALRQAAVHAIDNVCHRYPVLLAWQKNHIVDQHVLRVDHYQLWGPGDCQTAAKVPCRLDHGYCTVVDGQTTNRLVCPHHVLTT